MISRVSEKMNLITAVGPGPPSPASPAPWSPMTRTCDAGSSGAAATSGGWSLQGILDLSPILSRD